MGTLKSTKQYIFSPDDLRNVQEIYNRYIGNATTQVTKRGSALVERNMNVRDGSLVVRNVTRNLNMSFLMKMFYSYHNKPEMQLDIAKKLYPIMKSPFALFIAYNADPATAADPIEVDESNLTPLPYDTGYSPLTDFLVLSGRPGSKLSKVVYAGTTILPNDDGEFILNHKDLPAVQLKFKIGNTIADTEVAVNFTNAYVAPPTQEWDFQNIIFLDQYRNAAYMSLDGTTAGYKQGKGFTLSVVVVNETP